MISVAVGGFAVWVSYSIAAVTSILPPVADGSYKQWTPTGSGTTAHYTKVDESVCNGISDYVYTTSVGKKDSYKVDISSIPKGAVITSITVTPCASANSNSGNNSRMRVFYRTGATDYTHPTVYDLLGTTPTNLPSRSWNGLEMVKVSNTNLEVGAYYESGDKGVRLSRIAVNITYNTPYPSDLSGVLTCSATGIPQVTLNWSDNSLNEDRFEIARGNAEASLATYAYTDGPNVTTYSDTNLVAGQTYTYQVFSLKEGADNYRYYSNIVTVSVPSVSSCGSGFSAVTSTPNFSTSTPSGTNNFTSSTPTSTPSVYAPTNVTATLSCFSPTTTQVTLNWTDNTVNETGFEIKRSNTNNAFFVWGSVGSNITTFTDRLYGDYLSGQTLYYLVGAKTPGTTYYSESVSITLPLIFPCGSTPTSTPTSTPPTSTSTPILGSTGTIGVSVSSTCVFSAVVTWADTSTNETGFKVYRELLPSGSAPLASFTTGPNVTRYVDNTVVPGKSYSYFVSAFYNNTYSEAVNTASVTIPLCPR